MTAYACLGPWKSLSLCHSHILSYFEKNSNEKSEKDVLIFNKPTDRLPWLLKCSSLGLVGNELH